MPEVVELLDSLSTVNQSLLVSLHDNLSVYQFFAMNVIETLDEYLLIIRHGIHRPMVFLKRGINDIWTSPFNPMISFVLQSNMDIQFILDEYSCAAYAADYGNKSKRGFTLLHRKFVKLRDKYPDMDYDA